MGNIVYVDLENGISGDMFLGALLDLGGNVEELEKVIDFLNLENVHIEIEEKQDLYKGKDVTVKYKDQPHRKFSEIKEMIEKSDLKPNIKEKSIKIFKILGQAEAEVHDTDIDNVEFHEVGMVDSIIDIIGSVALLDDLDIDDIYCSTINLGQGSVKCTHGTLPVPVPATQKILQGWKVNFSEKKGELVTPTGAALVTALMTQETPPDMSMEKVGVGYGDRDTMDPNILRMYYGIQKNICKGMIKIVFYIDDMSPEVLSYAIEKIRKKAVDIHFYPAYGKKSRSGWEINVLCTKHNLVDVKEIIFSETTTLGMQVLEIKRVVADRKLKKIQTKWGPINLKISGERVAPEFEDCKKIAEENNVPIQKVFRIAVQKYKEQDDNLN